MRRAITFCASKPSWTVFKVTENQGLNMKA
jgi:hypothetical protein